MAEPGAGKSGACPPLSRRSIFSFRLASSDATRKEKLCCQRTNSISQSNLVLAFLVCLSSLPVCLLICLFVSLIVCLFVCFFEFSRIIHHLRHCKRLSILQGTLSPVSPGQFWWKLFFTIEYELRGNRQSIYLTESQSKTENKCLTKMAKKFKPLTTASKP